MSSELAGHEKLPHGHVPGGQARGTYITSQAFLVFWEDQKKFQQGCDSSELPLGLPQGTVCRYVTSLACCVGTISLSCRELEAGQA